MEIKINDNVTIYCELETSYFCGNVYHNVRVYENSKKILEEHIHCCDDEYEAIFNILNDSNIMWSPKFRQEALEVVSNHYLYYGE